MLKYLEGLSLKKFYKFKNNTLKFLVCNGYLFRRASKNILLRRIIDEEEN
jgi:hypothetical protein